MLYEYKRKRDKRNAATSRRKTTTAVRVGVDELVPKKEAIEFC